MDKTRFAIKYNNCASNDACAVCGKRTDPQVGPELMLADEWRVVCWDCGRKVAPELCAMLAAYRAIELVVVGGENF